MVFEFKYLHIAITFPGKGIYCCPVFFIETVGYFSSEDCAITAIQSGQIVELIQLIEAT